MKVCNKCNFSNEDENVVCTNCGALLEQPKSKYSFYNKPISKDNDEEKVEKDSFISKENAPMTVEDVVDKFKNLGRKVLNKLDKEQQKENPEFVYNEEEAKKVEMEQSKERPSFVYDEKAAKKAAKLTAKQDEEQPFFLFDNKAARKAEKIEEKQMKQQQKFFKQDKS